MCAYMFCLIVGRISLEALAGINHDQQPHHASSILSDKKEDDDKERSMMITDSLGWHEVFPTCESIISSCILDGSLKTESVEEPWVFTRARGSCLVAPLALVAAIDLSGSSAEHLSKGEHALSIRCMAFTMEVPTNAHAPTRWIPFSPGPRAHDGHKVCRVYFAVGCAENTTPHRGIAPSINSWPDHHDRHAIVPITRSTIFLKWNASSLPSAPRNSRACLAPGVVWDAIKVHLHKDVQDKRRFLFVNIIFLEKSDCEEDVKEGHSSSLVESHHSQTPTAHIVPTLIPDSPPGSPPSLYLCVRSYKRLESSVCASISYGTLEQVISFLFGDSPVSRRPYLHSAPSYPSPSSSSFFHNYLSSSAAGSTPTTSPPVSAIAPTVSMPSAVHSRRSQGGKTFIDKSDYIRCLGWLFCRQTVSLPTPHWPIALFPSHPSLSKQHMEALPCLPPLLHIIDNSVLFAYEMQPFSSHIPPEADLSMELKSKFSLSSMLCLPLIRPLRHYIYMLSWPDRARLRSTCYPGLLSADDCMEGVGDDSSPSSSFDADSIVDNIHRSSPEHSEAACEGAQSGDSHTALSSSLDQAVKQPPSPGDSLIPSLAPLPNKNLSQSAIFAEAHKGPSQPVPSPPDQLWHRKVDVPVDSEEYQAFATLFEKDHLTLTGVVGVHNDFCLMKFRHAVDMAELRARERSRLQLEKRLEKEKHNEFDVSPKTASGQTVGTNDAVVGTAGPPVTISSRSTACTAMEGTEGQSLTRKRAFDSATEDASESEDGGDGGESVVLAKYAKYESANAFGPSAPENACVITPAATLEQPLATNSSEYQPTTELPPSLVKMMMERTGLTREQLQAHGVALLYHTASGSIQPLLDRGFDMRMSKIGSFGRGCYFADSPFKSSHYYRSDWGVKPDNTRPQDRHMFVCLVALGRSHRVENGSFQTELFRAPTTFDSVVGNIRNGNELVVYDDRRVLITHILYYQGGPSPLPSPSASLSLKSNPMSAGPGSHTSARVEGLGRAPPSLPPLANVSSISSSFSAPSANISNTSFMPSAALLGSQNLAAPYPEGSALLTNGMFANVGSTSCGGFRAAAPSAPSAPSAPTGNMQTTTVMIPSALKIFLNELVDRASRVHQAKGLAVRRAVARLLRGHCSVVEFLHDVELHMGRKAPSGLGDAITLQLQRTSIKPPPHPSQSGEASGRMADTSRVGKESAGRDGDVHGPGAPLAPLSYSGSSSLVFSGIESSSSSSSSSLSSSLPLARADSLTQSLLNVAPADPTIGIEANAGPGTREASSKGRLRCSRLGASTYGGAMEFKAVDQGQIYMEQPIVQAQKKIQEGEAASQGKQDQVMEHLQHQPDDGRLPASAGVSMRECNVPISLKTFFDEIKRRAADISDGSLQHVSVIISKLVLKEMSAREFIVAIEGIINSKAPEDLLANLMEQLEHVVML